MILMGINNLDRIRGKEDLFKHYLDEINTMINNIQTEIDEINHIQVKISKTTDSMYMKVSFKNNKITFSFTVRNHPASRHYKAKKYMLNNYESIEDLKQSIKKDIHKFIVVKGIRC